MFRQKQVKKKVRRKRTGANGKPTLRHLSLFNRSSSAAYNDDSSPQKTQTGADTSEPLTKSQKKAAGRTGKRLRQAKAKVATSLSVLQSSLRGAGKKVKSKVFYRVPIMNLFWGFIDLSQDIPDWRQYVGLLNIIAIISALTMALLITFNSAITREEMEWASMRYAYGYDFNDAKTGLVYAPEDCYGSVSLAQGCIDKGVANGHNMTGWTASAEGLVCAFPCFSFRPVGEDALEEGGPWITGNYAKWWVIWHTSDDDPSVFQSDPNLDVTHSPVQLYSRNTSLAICLLATALIGSVVTLGLTTPLVFLRGGDIDSSNTHVYRVAARAWLYWSRFAIFGSVLAAVVGVVLFFQVIKEMVYIKFTDEHVAEHGKTPTWPFAGGKSPYGFTNTAILWFCYMPMLLSIFVLSTAVYTMHTFRSRPLTDLSSLSSSKVALRRQLYVKKMCAFLHGVCGMPALEADPSLTYGPRRGIRKGQRPDRGIYLAVAGGYAAVEAEVVADLLVDHGVYELETLLLMCLDTRYGGLGDPYLLASIPGLHSSVPMYVALGVESAVRQCEAKDLLKRVDGGDEEEAFAGFRQQSEANNTPTEIGLANIRKVISESVPEWVNYNPAEQALAVEKSDDPEVRERAMTAYSIHRLSVSSEKVTIDLTQQ